MTHSPHSTIKITLHYVPLTAVDAYFFRCFRRAISFKLDVSAYTSCLAHFERVHARPSVQKMPAYQKEVQDAFAKAG